MKKLIPNSQFSIPRYLPYGAVALFVYMPFHIFFSQWLSTYTGGLDAWKLWKDFFTATVTILCVVMIIFLKKASKLYVWLVGLTLIYLATHLLLLFLTNQPHDTGLLASAYNARLFAYAIIGYSLALLMPKTDWTRKLVKILIVLSTIVCLVALLQWVLPKDVMTHFGYSIERGVKPNFFIDDKVDFPRVFSTLRDPNSLGAFLILPIVLLAQALARNWRTSKRNLLAGLVLLHGLILLLTFSRSTLLATFIALISLLVLQNVTYIKKNIQLITAVSAVLVIAFGVAIYLARDAYVVQNLFFHADESTTLADPNELRVGLAERSITGIADRPLGHGPGTAGLVSTRLPNGLLTENYYLQILYEVGIAGFMIFIALLYLIISNLWKQRKNYLAVALIAGFIGLSFASLFFHTWSNEAVAISWFLIAGTTLSNVKRLL